MDERLIKALDKVRDKLDSWLDAIVLALPNFIIAVFVFILVLILSKYISKFVSKLLNKTSLQTSMKRLITKMVSVAVILLGLFLILGILNLSKALNTILAGAGVAGLAVGLALQGALSNTYSGIVLSYVKNIQFGDWIKTNNYEGEVQDINFRTLTLRQIDNNLVYIPNRLVIENPIKNYSQTDQSKVILKCGVGYGSKLREVKELAMATIVTNFDSVDSKDEVQFFWRAFGDSSINFEMRFWINSRSALEVANAKSEAIMLIKEAFDANGINIPFPIRTLDLPKDFINAIASKNPESQES